MKATLIAAPIISLLVSGCANIEHTSQLQQPTDRTLLAGPGDIVLRIERVRDLENIYGKADLFGRKTKEGHSEVHFAGVESNGVVVLYRKDVQIITNESTMSRTPVSTTSGTATTTMSGTASSFGNTSQVYGNATTNYSSTTLVPLPDYHVIVPSDTVAIRVAPNERILPVGGYIIEILRASPNAIEYRVTKQ